MTTEQGKIDNETNETVKENITDGAKYNDGGATTKAIGLSHLIGEYLQIVGYSHTRGEPTKYNQGNGEDNKADYHTIKLSKPISVTIVSKKDGTKTTGEYDGAFLTKTVLKQLNRIPDLLEKLEKEQATINVRVGTQWTDEYNKYYACLFFEGQDEYEDKNQKFKTN